MSIDGKTDIVSHQQSRDVTPKSESPPLGEWWWVSAPVSLPASQSSPVIPCRPVSPSFPLQLPLVGHGLTRHDSPEPDPNQSSSLREALKILHFQRTAGKWSALREIKSCICSITDNAIMLNNKPVYIVADRTGFVQGLLILTTTDQSIIIYDFIDL